jgi:hypothetical protein
MVKKPKVSFEEAFGTKWLPIIGITVIVLGVALAVGKYWGGIPHWGRALILYAGALALLGGGIFLEKKDRYATLGRGLIGGGWAILALVSYAIANVDPLQVFHSEPGGLALLLAVVTAMVLHTLKYRSQVVTGAGFLLGFVAIGMNPAEPWNLVAGALLIVGLTWTVRIHQWFELEVVGILATYINHFYWLYHVYGKQGGRATFPLHSWSVGLVLVYWAIFRASYLFRKITSKQQESVSTAAALLNPILFLVVMKYQGFHPEWAWWELAAIGALEFILGQLPPARQRRAPFQVLSSVGATLIVAAPAVYSSRNALEIIWLALAEAFLLAGIFTRERLFRAFGLIISFLVALYALPVRIVPLVQQVFNSEPHSSATLAVVLGVIALALYLNAHITRRVWPELFSAELEQTSLSGLSFLASLFAVSAVYAYVPDRAAAVVLAVLVLALTWTGKQFSISELVYEAHWVAPVAFLHVLVRNQNLETSWHGVPARVLTFVPVAALLYLSSRYVNLSQTLGRAVFAPVYACAGTALLTLMIWFQATGWLIALLWIVLALGLALAGEALKRVDFKWQAFALVLLAAVRAFVFDFNDSLTFHHLTHRLISISLMALGIYLLARWAPVTQIRPVYTVVGTLLLTVLAAKETPEPWTGVAWVGLALALSLAARLWKDHALLWQTHVLSLLAVVWMLSINFDSQYKGSQVQWITVSICVLAFYTLTWLTNIAALVKDERFCQPYAWAGSLLLSWLAWYQLQPVIISLAWGVFGLLLFELPEIAKAFKIDMTRTAASWRFQGYVALAFAFAHVFYSNFNVSDVTSTVFVSILVLIYFYVYWVLSSRVAVSGAEQALRIEYLLACLGTATLAGLARFELPADLVVIGYSGLVVGTLLAAWLAGRLIFLVQAMVLLVFAATRISLYNFYHLRDPLAQSLAGAIWAIALLACAVPLAFQVRKSSSAAQAPSWLSALAGHPEQPIFFVPVLLLAVLFFLKLSGAKVPGAWVAEGVIVFMLALWAKERSFRLTGLFLLLLGLGKLVYNAHANFLTWIGVGLAMVLVAFLYGKNREALREYM